MSKNSQIRRNEKRKELRQLRRMQTLLEENWKISARTRDDHTCQVCGKKLEGRNCQVHHIIPRQVKELKLDHQNSITLCVMCHKWGPYSAHTNGIWFTLFIKNKFPDRYNYLITKLKEIKKDEFLQ